MKRKQGSKSGPSEAAEPARVAWRVSLRVNAMSPVAARMAARERAGQEPFEEFERASDPEREAAEAARRVRASAWPEEGGGPGGYAVTVMLTGRPDFPREGQRREMWVGSWRRMDQPWASPDAWGAETPEELGLLKAMARASLEKGELSAALEPIGQSEGGAKRM